MTYQEALKEQETYQKLFNSYVEELYNRSDKAKLKDFAEMRKFSMETLLDAQVFYIGKEAEMLIPEYLESLDALGVISQTNRKPIFHDRYVIPIKDEYGNILNLVGYNKEADERYVYGTAQYYMRRNDMWGLERLHEAYDLGYAIILEGITDAMALRNIGYRPVFARCGTAESKLTMNILNRCRYGIIRIPDRDKAGLKALKHWECNRYITIKPFIKYKDIDQMLREEENCVDWVKSYIDNGIQWLKQKEHNGFPCEKVEISIS